MAAVPIRDVTRDDLKAGIARGEIVLLDVREAYEYESGHIPGAISFPLSTFDADSLPHGRVVFTCAAGVRSRHAVELARRAGLPHDEHDPGGFKGWASAGEPVAYD